MQYRIDAQLRQEVNLRRCELSECRAACCKYGAWVDVQQMQVILARSAVIARCMPASLRKANWFSGAAACDEHVPSGKVMHTRVVNRALKEKSAACVFLRQDYKCALQVAAEKNDLHPWTWKPFYCVLHPLEISDSGEITIPSLDELRQEKASCLRPSPQAAALIETLQPELEYLLGAEEFKRIKKALE